VHSPRSLCALALWFGCLVGPAEAVTAATAAPPAAPIAAPAAPAPPVAPQVAAAPTAAEIRAVVTNLRKDPNLGSEHIVRSLHWISSKAPPPPATPPWLVGLFQFLSQAIGALVWVAGSIGAAVAVVWIFRLLRARSPSTRAARTAPASHVGELDIRPNSLPDDVGAAALALLQSGRTRDALSLLYRGALSRAVHRFGVPISDSFTEGEVLRAVAARLDRPRADYFNDLVGAWQHAVYGGHAAATGPVAALCTTFAPTLGGAA
jgi:Domain of unknown function (DUF4129)